MPDRILFFAGMGADSRLLDAQRKLAVTLDTPKWLEPLPQETLPGYAARMAEQIDTTTPFFLGGISFGGMVALEVARHVQSRGVILISSCRSGRAIPAPGRWLGRCARFAPLPLIRPMKRVPGIARRLMGAADASQTALFNAMLADTSPRLLRWAVPALLCWTAQPIDAPVFHIHGGRDRVIPLRRVQADHVIAAAGHLMNLTHADEVNAAISQWLARYKCAPRP